LYIPAREEHPIENIDRKKGNKWSYRENILSLMLLEL
jgi:hypothetical protein